MVDRVECSAVYIDDRVRSERWVRRGSVDESTVSSSAASFTQPDEPDALHADLEQLLEVCKKIYLCQTGSSFATKLAELSDRSGSDCIPIFAFFSIDFSSDELNIARRKASRASWGDTGPPSPSSFQLQRTFTFSSRSDEAPGLSLLSGVSTDIQVQDCPNLVIPIAILRTAGSDAPDSTDPNERLSRNPVTLEHKQIARCLDAGAVDVLTTPLDRGRIQGLVVHSYRTRRTAQREMSRFLARRKQRKHSWVGVHDEEPYAYLREAMVSKLMNGICNPEEVIHDFQDRALDIEPARETYIRAQVGRWNFSAHELSEDELVFGACAMLQHAFTLPGLEHWQLTFDELRTFLLACRAAYNSFVLYHNFRHAIDVLQSVFVFLLHIGALPHYKPIGQVPVSSKAPITQLLSPFDSLTLLIAAIGHDVGHPGVNNFFLVKLNAPLAQLYNDNSVLEAFHCAAFSQILRRHWPAAFKDKQLRKLLISTILATDMGVHQKFMQRMGSLQEKYHENNRSLDGWKPQDIEMYKSLLCGLIIKCADISNVARPWTIAERWTTVLQEEFANQGEMEKEVGMETALFGGPPELGNVYKLATGQIGFMSIFALPLFEGVSDFLPQMQFTCDAIRRNLAQWQQYANDQLRRQALQVQTPDTVTISPRSRSPIRPIVKSVPEGVAPIREGPLTTGSDASTPRPGAYQGSAIEPVTTVDTPGPQIEITGSSMVPDVSSCKSSNAVPDLSYFSIPTAPHRGGGLATHQYQTPFTDPNRSPNDPAVLATALYANSAKGSSVSRGTTAQDQSNDSPPEKSFSYRQFPHGFQHHAHHSSSARTSAPSNSNRNSCTRTQSISTYSNNMTPISPATNATSLLAVDSSDENRASNDSAALSDLGPEGTSARPSTSYVRDSNGGYYARRASGRGSGLYLGRPMSDDGRGYSKNGLNGSLSADRSANNDNNKNDHLGDDSRNGLGFRKLGKRRSRLRLAFWKRRPHQQQEVHGES
ncbi:hypothetical protein N7495_005015 [Penicillium taxi]|uniref:uncharacterized protein n=1 Tax=Penicillium taxi TaxID=168475 RepID=UPI002544DAD3|nr:uncharacterized protein N7495_005015 [Penicillium taxi]KAJ5893324.1 hypothetical protein N7495_005015 [Penicillium taxi]